MPTADAAAVLLLVWPLFAADGVEVLLRETHWGEASDSLLHQFGAAVEQLPRPLDFGDSYADIVLRGNTFGGVPMVVFFQMDKATHGLKRLQLEPLGHRLNPPDFRAVAAALHAEYGSPDHTCVTPPLPAAGYQAAVEEIWTRNDTVVSAIFRDTTLQAFEGCLYGPASGWCGLHGQLLVRIARPNLTPIRAQRFGTWVERVPAWSRTPGFAPIPAVRGPLIEPRESTLNGPSAYPLGTGLHAPKETLPAIVERRSWRVSPIVVRSG